MIELYDRKGQLLLICKAKDLALLAPHWASKLWVWRRQ